MYEPWHSTRSDETARLLRGHCQHFSRLGWALFAQMLSMLLAQAGILLIVGVCAPGPDGEQPVFVAALRPFRLWDQRSGILPGDPPRAGRAGPGAGRALGAGTLFSDVLHVSGGLYLANYATLALLWVVGQLAGARR